MFLSKIIQDHTYIHVYVRFKRFERKIKSPFMKSKNKVTIPIHADFESVLVSIDNGKQNPNEQMSNMNKCQKYIACSYGYN